MTMNKELKEAVDLLNYLENETAGKVISLGKNMFRINPCPICGHKDCFTVYANTNSYCCFSSSHDSGGTIIDFLIEYENITLPEAIEMTKELAGIDDDGLVIEDDFDAILDNIPDEGLYESDEKENGLENVEIDKFYSNVKKTDYFADRGISDDLIEKYKLGYDPDYNAVVLPCFDENDKLIFLTKRYIKPNKDKNKYYNSCSVKIFNEKYLYSKKPKEIFVTEGMFDALSIEQVTGEPAVALNSHSNIDKLIAIMEKKKLPKNKNIIYLADNDGSKEKAESKLKDYDVKVRTLSKYIDANEYLQNKEEQRLKKELRKIKSEFYCDFNYTYLNNFFKEVKERKNTAIKTNFTELDKVLNGGLYPGIYVIGAISSLGKSTYCLQMADQIAANGQDVLFFALEQSRFELTSKSIVRELYKMDETNITTTDFLNGKIKDDQYDLIQKALAAYNPISQNIAIFEGSKTVEQIQEKIEEVVKYRNQSPVIFVDYLQIINISDSNLSYRQAVDRNLSCLKEISVRYQIPVIVVSSLNRHNYKNLISFESFKESGTIEYSSDVVLGMQLQQMREKITTNDQHVKMRDINQWKAEVPRKIELVILKQRNGEAFSQINYKYETIFNYFEEVGVNNL